ncbi:hypothetical protein WJX74_005642, partial [Apatococcus lobatus]
APDNGYRNAAASLPVPEAPPLPAGPNPHRPLPPPPGVPMPPPGAFPGMGMLPPPAWCTPRCYAATPIWTPTHQQHRASPTRV